VLELEQQLTEVLQQLEKTEEQQLAYANELESLHIVNSNLKNLIEEQGKQHKGGQDVSQIAVLEQLRESNAWL